jgi:cellulose synthase/poly-beta-1,6-N-acetylglucosamine synthase-like glycosyltransferase/Leucine-rich repeat (LRR) protein
MLNQRRTGCARRWLFVCLLGVLVTSQAPGAEPANPLGSTVLLDFEDDSQFALLRGRVDTRIEPTAEAVQGKRAAKVVYGAVPEGVRDFPAVVVEGQALAIRDFSPFEAISLRVLNPGPDDAELSLAVWDKDGNRGFPLPSTFTIKPGPWNQIVSRLVLHGIDARQIGSVHFYQKSNRRPITLLIDDIQLLSPYAGRIAAQIQRARDNLTRSRGSAAGLGAREPIDAKIAALAQRLDRLEDPAGIGNRTQRLLELARVAKETQELANAIGIRNGGKDVRLTGPQVEAGWLRDPDKVRLVATLRLLNTPLGDEVFSSLAPAQDLETLVVNSKRFTGAGLGQLSAGKLHRLAMPNTSAHDAAFEPVRHFRQLQQLELQETNVTSGLFRHLEGLDQLQGLALGGTGVADAGFSGISKLLNLESLELDRTRISGESLQHLAGLTRLHSLDLRHTRVDDAGLSHLGNLVHLEELLLEDTPITGAGFDQLKGLDKLVTLNLNGTRVGDSALRRLGKLPRLKRLELSGTRITDGTLRQLLPSVQLEYLDLYGTNITDSGLAFLQNQHGLQDLYLAGTQTSDSGAGCFAKLTELRQLDLEGTPLTDAGLQHLQGLTELVALKLGKTRITGVGLAHLAGLAKLQFLDLSGTGVTDEALADLARLENLRTLLLNGTRVNGAGLRALQGARKLLELHLEATAVGDQGLEFLTTLPNLQQLNLNETAVTDEGLKHLKRMEKLRSVSLNHTRVTDQGLSYLGDAYTTLELTHTRITDQGVEHLQRCGQLVQLRLASTGITNDALKLLQAMPNLRQLDLAETRVDDAGLQHLALLPELKELHLDNTSVSDRGIDPLLRLSGLRRVSLENARVTAPGASYLKLRSPELQVDLVFPWVWGERWSSYDVPREAEKSAQPADPTTLLRQLKDLTNLGSLRLDDSLLTPEVLRSLKDLPTLEHLSFQGTAMADEMVADLLGLSQVVRLDLSQTRITDRGLIHLKDMQGLRELHLQGIRVTGSGLIHLANLTRLQTLNLQGTPLQDSGLAHLAGLKELRKLELGDTRLTDAGIDHLLPLTGLQYLDLYGTALTDAGLARLSRLTSLRYCYLSNSRITDAGVEHLRRLTDLEELGLDGTQVTDRGLPLVISLPNLRRLRMGRTPVTNAGVEMLRAMPLLRSLDLSGTRITDEALATLAGFPALAEVDVRDTALTAEAVGHFRQAHPAVRVAFGTTPVGYSPWSVFITVLYSLAIGAICFYGLHRYWLAWLFLSDRQARRTPEPTGRFADLPAVTVQLPMFNERHVAERIIEAACALDYPRDRLQVQVLDDSTDESADIARRCCERHAAAGHPVEYLHRSARDGFKGGALAAGLGAAAGEYIAVFDADFLPDPDFLRRTVHYFTDARVGMVQAEWSHLNRGESLLTEIQAMFLDGHFVVEQTIRSHRGRWFNFNGTAGVWRRRCIEDAGGWQHDTLTEDTDLSYRAQLNGWKFLYLPAVRCRGELPSTLTAFLGQQHRWTKGLIQTGKKLLPRILTSSAPWTVKLEAWFHLTSPVMYLVMLVVTAIAFPALFLATPFTDQAALGLTAGLATLLLGTVAAGTFYVVSQRAQGFPLGRTLLNLPVLMALGIGMCAVNARAVLEAFFGFQSPFVRTPKFGGRRDWDPGPSAPRRRWATPAGLVELVMAGVLYACLVLSFLRPFTLIGAPFLLLFALGYTGVGVLSLLDGFRPLREPMSTPATPRLRHSLARLAIGGVALGFLACVSATVLAIASPPRAWSKDAVHDPVSLGLDLTTARWHVVGRRQDGAEPGSAVRHVYVDRGSLVLNVQLDETTDQGEIMLDLDGAMKPLGDSMGSWKQLAFTVEFPSRFTGEFQAFVKDSDNRSEYGSAEFIESHDPRRAATVTLVPGLRVPPMGYQDQGFDPGRGIHQIGLKISAQSDRVRGTGYRPFRGTIRVAKVRITGVDRHAHPEPEVRPADEPNHQPPILSAGEFLAASGVDRPWPLGYGFSGPITDAHRLDLEKTYSAVARLGCRLTRVYVGDYRTGLVLDQKGKIAGVEPEFLEYLDRLAEVANRHGITVMFSLTDNTLADGRGLESVELIRDGEASDLFVNNVLVEFVKRLKDRQVIWDVFNEPENVTAIPLRDVQRYVDRVVAAGRRAVRDARFTVVSRSRPEIAYWRGRGLDLYSHNIFTERSLTEALASRHSLDTPVLVAEMAPVLATETNLNALREAGYGGVGIWGWGTGDKYEWNGNDLERIVRPLLPITEH